MGGLAPARVVEVGLAARAAARYDVVVGAGAVTLLGGKLAGLVPGRRAFVVVDDGLPGAIGGEAAGSLRGAGFGVETLRHPSAERAKRWESAGRLVEWLTGQRAERGDVVVSVGGGALTDVAGFAAAVYRRGLAHAPCPTTLLAMVDAAVGGKTGVNVEVGGVVHKNMAGCFHQPVLVVADTAALATLPVRDRRAGLAECVKHAMIARSVARPDPGLAGLTLMLAPGVLGGDAAAAAELVARHVALKAGVVQEDELELRAGGGRAMLNLGHTFGHAMETLPGLDLRHGEAVALGLVAATATAESLGLVGPAVMAWLRGALRACGLPERAAGLLGAGAMIERMRSDKKAAGGKLRLVLPVGEGEARVVEDPALAGVEAGWDAVRGG